MAPRNLLPILLALPMSLAPLASGQIGGGESPFKDTHLPFEALKAEPSGAFEIIMICLGVFMLAGILTGVFLGIGKLGAIQEELRAAAAGRRRTLELLETLGAALETSAAEPKAAPDPATLEIGRAVATGQEQALEELRALRGSVGDLGEVLAAGREVDDRGMVPAVDPAAALAAFAERIEAALDSSSRTQTAALGGLAETLSAQLASAGDGNAAPAPPAEAAPAPVTIDTIRGLIEARLKDQGYGEVHFVTPLSELEPAALTEAGARSDVLIEARRSGSSYKGRIVLEGGRIADVILQPAHRIFP